MTEKRFTINDCRVLSDEQVLKILNQLTEENEQLKSKYSEQCIQLDFLKDENQHMRDLVNENRQLKKENKELQSDRDYWKTLAQSLARTNGNVELKDEHLAWKRVDVE